MPFAVGVAVVYKASPKEPHRLNRRLQGWRKGLERRLRQRLLAAVRVEITDNTHTMVTFRRLEPGWRLRLHHMFLAAPAGVLGSLADYVRDGDTEASTALDRFIERNSALIRRLPPAQLRRRQRIDPRGEHHDLAEIYQRLNRHYFRGGASATITYGPAPRTARPRKSIKLGSYSPESRVIRIHPALDQASVPRYFVEWIVFHEMLHDLYPARRKGDRRCIHTEAFLARERQFEQLERAQAWEDRNLDLLLSSQP